MIHRTQYCRGCRRCCYYGAALDTTTITYRPKISFSTIYNYTDLSGRQHQTGIYATYELASAIAKQISTQCRHYKNR